MICVQQYGFVPRKNTIDTMFALRIWMEKYRQGQKKLYCESKEKPITESQGRNRDIV